MKPNRRPLHLTRETIRQLTEPDLGRVAGGRPTSFPQCLAVRAGTTSEAEGAGPCPGEYSYVCRP